MRQRGIRKLGKNHYQICVVAIDPRTGMRKEVKRRVRGSAEDALSVKRAIREEIEHPRATERVRLKDYADSWLRMRLGRLKPSTARKYAEALELHILPALGDFYVDQLRPSDVAAFCAKQSERLEGWTVTNQLRVLRTIAKDAEAAGLTERDFCARVRPPAGRVYSEDDPNLLSAEELRQVLAAVPRSWYALTLLLATTGLRWGEASGLRWDDIDEASGRIHVRRTNWKGQAVAPKTERSRRTVALLPEVAEALREHRGRLLREQNRGLEAGWVFPTRSGGLQRGTPLIKVLTRALGAAGVGHRVTPHGLRRTFNNLARQVTSREVLKSITGHVTDAMVEHYSVVGLAEKQRAAAGVLRLVTEVPDVETQVETKPAAPCKSGGATRI